MSILKILLLVGIILYLGLGVIAYFLSDRLIFYPPSSSYTVEQLPVTWIPTEDNTQIAVLYLPNPEASYTILYSHGNAEDLGYLAGLLVKIRQVGYSVIAYDYRGYGLSSREVPGEQAVYQDEAAVYRYATQTLGIPSSQLILFGRSVGSGPAIHLAQRETVAGLIVESGFVSAFRVATHVTLLPFDKFPNLRHIQQVHCPVLVIHGTEDKIIPPWHGRKLFEAAPEPKRNFWVKEAGHNDIAMIGGEQYWQVLREFQKML